MRKIDRRDFLTWLGGGAVAATGMASANALGEEDPAASNGEQMGMLVDTTECIGCRKCEYACATANSLTDFPLEHYEDTTVFDTFRRPSADAFTVVNRFSEPGNEKPTFVKTQCMHCVRPACASACIVGALRKQPNGAVTYDAWKCLGCRYCMIACPFQIPAYEYSNAFAPKVRKCGLCFDLVTKEGKMPACAEMCPPNALTFAPREKLITLAHDKIAANPGKYNDHVYGEHEVGGTSWLYLTSRPAVELGMLALPDKPAPELTETIQHSVFKFGIPPLLLYGLLTMAMRTFGKEEAVETVDVDTDEEDKP